MGEGLLLDPGDGSSNPVARSPNQRYVLAFVEDTVPVSSLSLPLPNDSVQWLTTFSQIFVDLHCLSI